jgi:hypothetical protein
VSEADSLLRILNPIDPTGAQAPTLRTPSSLYESDVGGQLKISTILLLACVLAGCSPSTIPPDKVVPLNSPILIHIHENLLAKGRTLQLQCVTESIYPCSNYGIAMTTLLFGPSWSIDFTGVSKPELCDDSLGPARATISLGSSREGERPISLVANGSRTVGVLVIGQDSIVVRGGDGPWIKVPRPVLHRVPPGTIWGLVGWGPSDQSGRAQAFIDSLQSIGAQSVLWTPGDYDFFKVGADGTLQRPDNDGYYHARAFALRLDTNRSAVPEVMRAYADSLSISVYGDRGESWSSWSLPQSN